ncbi:MAG: hypothetical protein M1837_002407 [Sclerophora amabilis]|nr:MAG: hypothetical protein M1837_002407 [Sclerophora amabilis]
MSLSRPRIAVPTIEAQEGPRRLHVLAACGISDFQPNLILSQLQKWCELHRSTLELRCLYDERSGEEEVDYHYSSDNIQQQKVTAWCRGQSQLSEICRWADILLLAPIEAGQLAGMLQGFTNSTMLEILRGWDVSKKILLVPAMTALMWENPMTKKQLNKIRRKWTWIRVMQPLLWYFCPSRAQGELVVHWDGYEELVDAVSNQADLMAIGQDVDTAMGSTRSYPFRSAHQSSTSLPPEIWSIILEKVGDWEIAKSLGIFINLPTPPEWQRGLGPPDSRTPMNDLELTLLTMSYKSFIAKLEAGPVPPWLSPLVVKLVIKFNITDLLSYLEIHHKELFWATFGQSLLPTKASAFFGSIAVLEWWRTSPSFLIKEYNHEVIDGASKAGFVHVLDWWRKSGLPLRYTEAALEQASSKGNIEVLDWWKNASMHQGGYHTIESDATFKFNDHYHPAPSSPARTTRLHPSFDMAGPPSTTASTTNTTTDGPLRLLVGRSICFAAQNGQVDAVRWWDSSGIPYSHEDAVAKIASTAGAVNVLQLWKELKGEKMIFDNQVLAGPTKGGHRDVLEWWKNSGFKIDYRPCDIEEALEDSLGGEGEEQVKIWWARNGLNLGVGTSEWMRVKTL